MDKHLFSFPFVFFLGLFPLPFWCPGHFPPLHIKAEYDLCKNPSGQCEGKPSVGCFFFFVLQIFVLLVDFYIV